MHDGNFLAIRTEDDPARILWGKAVSALSVAKIPENGMMTGGTDSSKLVAQRPLGLIAEAITG